MFFELERNWTGILIEPVPSLYQSILSKNRNIFSINACIAESKPIVAKFRICDALSGRLKEMKDSHSNRINMESGCEKMILLYVPCFSLNTILSAINVKKVDYFSLDVEGGEYSVLQSIKFDKTTIDSFSIEHNGFADEKDKIISHLQNKGFTNIKSDIQDVYFLRK